MKDRAPGDRTARRPGGEGDLPFPAIVDRRAGRSASSGTSPSRTSPRDPLDDIARAYRYLARLAR